MASKQFILIHPGGNALGTKREILETLARFNTAPDGSKEAMGVAFGPGFHVELPWVDDRDPIQQAALTVADQATIAGCPFTTGGNPSPCVMDIESGQIFGEPSA